MSSYLALKLGYIYKQNTFTQSGAENSISSLFDYYRKKLVAVVVVVDGGDGGKKNNRNVVVVEEEERKQ